MSKRRYRIRRGQKHYMRGTGRGTNVFTAGQVIELYPLQAKGIMDKLIPLDEPQEPGEDPTPENTAPEMELKHVGGGRYNVIHPETGEPINDETLSKTEAEEMISSGTSREGDETDDDEG